MQYFARRCAPQVDLSKPPTARELEIFVTVVERGDKEAALALGITEKTVRGMMTRLYHRLGALNKTHAAVMLYPSLADRYIIQGDRR